MRKRIRGKTGAPIFPEGDGGVVPLREWYRVANDVRKKALCSGPADFRRENQEEKAVWVRVKRGRSASESGTPNGN